MKVEIWPSKPRIEAETTGLREPDSRVVQEVARREVVGAVDDHVVRLDELEDVRGVEASVVLDDVHVRVERLDRSLRRSRLGDADSVGRVDHLALEVGGVDHVVVDDPDRADPGRGEIESGRRAEPTGAEQKDLGVQEGDLALDADLGQERVARVAVALLGREALRVDERVARFLPRDDARPRPRTASS